MRSKLMIAINLLLGAALLWLVVRASGSRALAILAANPDGAWAVAALLAVFATIVTLSWRWGYLMGEEGAALGLLRLTLFRSAAHTLAVLVPSGKLGGDPLRAWLAARSGVTTGRSIAGVVVDRTLELGSSAPFSVLFAALLLQAGIPQLQEALVTVVVSSLALVVGVTLAVRRLRHGRGLVTSLARTMRLDQLPAIDARMTVVEDAERDIVALAGHPGRLVAAFSVGLVANVLVILEFVALLHAFGLPTETTAVVAAIFATGAAHMLPIPAGVGVLEGAQVWIFQMLGYPAEVGLAVGLAVRLRELLWMAPGAVYLLRRSVRAVALSTSGEA
jgi:uncharacterized protein (TIRG00374 family)